MKTLIIDNHTKYISELVSIFPGAEVSEKGGIENINFEAYDLIVLSGGSGVLTALNHPEEYINEIKLIKNSRLPIIGVCLGAEILTLAFGGELKELSSEHRGSIRLKILDEDLKVLLKSGAIEVKEGHRIGIKNMPSDFVVCAESEHSPEIIKHKSMPIIGFQFHPEISDNKKIIDWALAICNMDLV